MKKECKTVRPSPSDTKRLKEITEQVNRLSLEISQIIERTLEFPKTSPETPVAKFTFTPGKATEDALLDVVRVDGDIIWVGCYQNPPGVCCAGPCPCE
ncbi:MAG: hypothetical protein HC836_23635 [Richelia sp. RM2_1_2]|nr:hypothetical protein [Richelia sp. RM2_1_2]